MDAEIVDLVGEEEVVEEIERADTYMEDVYEMMARLEELSEKKALQRRPRRLPCRPKLKATAEPR